jgi:transposase
MNESTRVERLAEVVRVGVDLAKQVIQVHAVDGVGRVVVTRALQRDKFVAWCSQLAPGCMVVMEVSSSAHHWSRKLQALGLDARIVAAQLAAPYRAEGATGKNDANDAAAICEAAGRPHMRFVPVKSVEQQAMLSVHRLREGVKEDRNACVNRIRGLLLEFGVAIPTGVTALQHRLDEVLEDGANEMNWLARVTLQRAQAQWRQPDEHLAWCDERIAEHSRCNDGVQRARELMGVGPVGASAAVATVGDFKQFKRAARSSAPGSG